MVAQAVRCCYWLLLDIEVAEGEGGVQCQGVLFFAVRPRTMTLTTDRFYRSYKFFWCIYFFVC